MQRTQILYLNAKLNTTHDRKRGWGLPPSTFTVSQ